MKLIKFILRIPITIVLVMAGLGGYFILLLIKFFDWIMEEDE